MRARTIAVVIVGLLLVGGVAAAVVVIRHGFSARDEPTRAEAFVAQRLRHLAVPSRAKALQNPVALTPRCSRPHAPTSPITARSATPTTAAVHGNRPELYPKAPDMRRRRRTAERQLYHIIQNGVRLTGMSAWGAKDDEQDEDSWTLVH